MAQADRNVVEVDGASAVCWGNRRDVTASPNCVFMLILEIRDSTSVFGRYQPASI
jgi:hypothetical protein